MKNLQKRCIPTCFLISFLFAFSLSASPMLDIKITVQKNNATLSQVLNEIEKKTGYSFLVRDNDININEHVSIDAEDKTVEEILDELLADRQIRYTVDNKKISIYKPKAESGLPIISQSNKRITGVVKDENGIPIIGANVVAKGTNLGSISDMDGQYAIDIPQSATTLTISYIGYISQDIRINNQSVINIILLEDLQRLEEVVVVGYGTQRKRDVTGSVSSLSDDLIAKQNTVNPTIALRGQIAGLSIQQTSGRAGGEATVTLRGQSKIGDNVPPLVIIDGMPSSWGAFEDMDPNDIERIDVLKDASSTAIYGSRASGGVIIITTKAGREQKNVVSYRGNVGVKKLTRNPEMMNTQQFHQFYLDGVAYRGEPNDNKIMADDQGYIDRGMNTNWLDFITRDGFETNHSVSLSGGSKNETHYMSLGYRKEDGIQKSEGYERFSLSARVTGKVLDKITAGASLYASYGVTNRGNQNMLNSAYRLRPWGNPLNDDGTDRFFPTQNESALVNPKFDLENTNWQRKRIQARGSAFLEYNPIKGLSLKTNFMPNFSMDRTGEYIGEWTRNNVGKEGTSTANSQVDWAIGYLWENTVNYNITIDKDHSIGLTGLFSMEDGLDERYYARVQDLTYPDEYWYNFAASTSIQSLTSRLRGTSMISYMGRVNYGFKEKYLLTLTGRWDGSSKLAEGNKWGFFPSAALAWRAGEEEFIKKLDLFSNLKLRLSYGVAGNNQVDPYSSFATLSTTIYAWDETSAKGSAAKMANRALGWEKSYEYNLGLDMGFMDERLTVILDLYNKTTEDLILDRQIPSHQGVSVLKQNVGSVRNKGLEVTVNSLNVKTNDFSWRTTLSFDTNKNEIIDLYGDKTDDVGNKWFIGHPVTVSYDYKFLGIWQLGEEAEATRYGARPGYVKLLDVDGSGSITPERDRVILGNPFPNWSGGITNTFTYNNLDLSFFVYTRQGTFVKSGFHDAIAQGFQETRYNVPNLPYWTPDNPSNRWRAAGSANTNGDMANYMSTSFWRVGHITLGYDFKQKAIKNSGVSNLRAYLQVNNPFVFTKYDGWDPEYGHRNTDYAPLNGVTYMVGVNLSF